MIAKLAKLKQVILLGMDFTVLYASLLITLFLRYGSGLEMKDWQTHLVPFTAIYVIWVVVFYINGLYDLTTIANSNTFWKTFFASLGINALLAITIFYLNPALEIAPKTNLLINIVVFTALFFLWRQIFNRFLLVSVFKNKIIIIGEGPEISEITEIIYKNPQLGYEIVGKINTDFSENLENLIFEKKADTVIIPSNLNRSENLTRHLYKCIFQKVSFIDSVSFYENLTGKIPVSAVTEHWFLEHLREGDKRVYDAIKTSVDIIFAIFLAIFTLILIPFIALAITLDDKGPIFYKQKRIGKFGKVFEIIKFRTMRVDAEKMGAQFASAGDERITRFGKFMRETRIDELPQFINILRRDMSIIGPRPERPEFVDKLQTEMSFYSLRHLAKPGLTGWAQISYQYAGSIEENLKKLQYDLFYIKNRSPLIDIKIILKTVNILLQRKGR